MLSNLRKKLTTAIQEGFIISENLQQQYRQHRSNGSTPTESVTGIGSIQNVNMAAGCNLLAKYEDEWKEIHEANENNAQQAAQICKQIDEIGQRTEKQKVDVKDLIICLTGIPALVEKVKKSAEALQEINRLCDTAEEELQRLEDLCEECELQEFMLQKQFELQKYKQSKMASLEVHRQKVAAKHQEKIRQYEDHLHQIQRERQAVFDDAFRNDLAEFKQKGVIPKIDRETQKETLLEEVCLEDNENKDALEEFLSR